MLITQAKAKQMIRNQTGASWDTIDKEVERLFKRPDGRREKVFLQQVDSLIDRLSTPPALTLSAASNNVRPISPRLAEKIRKKV